MVLPGGSPTSAPKCFLCHGESTSANPVNQGRLTDLRSFWSDCSAYYCEIYSMLHCPPGAASHRHCKSVLRSLQKREALDVAVDAMSVCMPAATITEYLEEGSRHTAHRRCRGGLTGLLRVVAMLAYKYREAQMGGGSAGPLGMLSVHTVELHDTFDLGEGVPGDGLGGVDGYSPVKADPYSSPTAAHVPVQAPPQAAPPPQAYPAMHTHSAPARTYTQDVATGRAAEGLEEAVASLQLLPRSSDGLYLSTDGLDRGLPSDMFAGILESPTTLSDLGWTTCSLCGNMCGHPVPLATVLATKPSYDRHLARLTELCSRPRCRAAEAALTSPMAGALGVSDLHEECRRDLCKMCAIRSHHLSPNTHCCIDLSVIDRAYTVGSTSAERVAFCDKCFDGYRDLLDTIDKFQSRKEVQERMKDFLVQHLPSWPPKHILLLRTTLHDAPFKIRSGDVFIRQISGVVCEVYCEVNAALARQELPPLSDDLAGQLLGLASACLQSSAAGDGGGEGGDGADARPSISNLVSSSMLAPAKLVRRA